MKKMLAVFGVLVLLVGGGLSLFASSYPDGLEWSVNGVLRQRENAAEGEAAKENADGLRELEAKGAVYNTLDNIQQATSVMPDYEFKDSDSTAGASVAGIVGSIGTLLLAGGVGLLISKAKRKAVKN